MTLLKKSNGESTRSIDRGINFPVMFNDILENFLGNEFLSSEMINWVPAVNICESADDFRIDVAAPGLTKNDFKVEVNNGILSVSGERKEESKENNKKYTKREFSYGSFKRAFRLPDFLDVENINAHYDNGVLSLTIPKKEEARQKSPKEIKIS